MTYEHHNLFFSNQFPNAATHCDQGSCGFSVYRNVLIQWDEDHDLRIMDFIDALPKVLRKNLVVVQEHEGNINFVWSLFVPRGYESEKMVDVPDGDCWYIMSSIVCCKYYVI